jgi:hypothetical protein
MVWFFLRINQPAGPKVMINRFQPSITRMFTENYYARWRRFGLTRGSALIVASRRDLSVLNSRWATNPAPSLKVVQQLEVASVSLQISTFYHVPFFPERTSATFARGPYLKFGKTARPLASVQTWKAILLKILAAEAVHQIARAWGAVRLGRWLGVSQRNTCFKKNSTGNSSVIFRASTLVAIKMVRKRLHIEACKLKISSFLPINKTVGQLHN